LWKEVEAVASYSREIRLSYWTEKNRLRTIVIPPQWIKNKPTEVKQLFITYGMEVSEA